MKSILLIGVNRFGSLLANQFSKHGHEIMAIDKNEDRVNAILPVVTDAQIGDSTNEAFLRSLGVNNYDVCIVTIGGDFQSSLETTSLLKELGGKMVVSRADRDVQAKFLLRNGADEVIIPEKQIAQWAAIRYGSEHVLDYLKLDDDHAIYEVPVPKDWIGKSIAKMDVRKKFGINILGVKENGKMNLSVTPETVLSGDKSILVLGKQ
ncbi:MAG: TrkA family potassium uptake protein, partial [Ruminococcus sp.]|nr:TrkA family potassium uptake protein [Ruminococcus sp.]